MTLPVATIGYEAAPLDEVLAKLKAARVELLIDVRAVASSRRAGFSKTLLAGSVEGQGIGYLHLRDLGTPKSGRMAARAGHTEEMHAIFAEHMQTAAALGALEEAVRRSQAARVCLLCYEADPHCCHREIVADMISARTGAQVVHL
jgi:uncharacterized protein (DUF488 family)